MDQNVQQGTHSQSSGMRRSLELSRASTEHSIQVGLRHFNFPSSQRYLEDSGLARITAAQFSDLGTDAVVAQILKRIAGADHVHFSFDIDAIDPAHAPGAGALEPGGITSRQAIEAVSALAPYCDSVRSDRGEPDDRPSRHDRDARGLPLLLLRGIRAGTRSEVAT